MNATHIHLLTNHIPIIGFACGIFVLLWGIIGKNKGAVMAACILLSGSGVGGFIANKTGEDAEHSVEKLAGVNQYAIDHHEEAAEAAMPFIAATVLLSLTALFLNYRNHRFAGISNLVLCIVGLIAFFLSARAGSIGGEIRHSQEMNAIDISGTGEESHDKD